MPNQNIPFSAMVLLYVPDPEVMRLPHYVTHGLLQVTRQKPACFATIAHRMCACGTSDVVVNGRDIITHHAQSRVLGYPAYRIVSSDDAEWLTVVCWLVQPYFYQFSYIIRNGSLERPLTPVSIFKPKAMECGCVRYTCERNPTYFLKEAVLSGKNQGTTIGSTIE